MQTFKRSAAFIKRRNRLLMLPVLILPFIIILFPILSGGNSTTSRYSKQKQTGLNFQLPDAHFLGKKEPDKLSLYEASGRDPIKIKMALRNDPYRMYATKPSNVAPEKDTTIKNIFEHSAERFPTEDLVETDPTMAGRETAKKANELMEKLSKLKSRLNNSSPVDSQFLAKDQRQAASYSTARMPNQKENGINDNEPDPEMDQLNKMLDKVMAIQHPESITDFKPAKSSDQNSLIYAVSRYKESDEPGSFGNREPKDSIGIGNENWFYGLVGDQAIAMQADNSIQAVVPEDQTLVSGSTIKLRLLSGIRINGRVIPADQFIYGTCSIHNERLEIRFSSIRCANSILPVALEAYDLDGLAGIFIPGSINRDAIKQSGDQAINSLGIPSLDPSIGAQAASAGIQTARTLLSHKVKLDKVTVKAGYQVLLKDDKK